MTCPIYYQSTNLPTLNDDACNSSGNGFFVKGSTWLQIDVINPVCKRLFIQQSDVCNMADWLEIELKQKTNIIANTSNIQNFPRSTIPPDNPPIRTKVVMDTFVYDELNEYNLTTGIFTPKCDGIYKITNTLVLELSTHDNFTWGAINVLRGFCQISLHINSVLHRTSINDYLYITNPAFVNPDDVYDFSPTVSLNATVQLTANDQIEFYFAHNLSDIEKFSVVPNTLNELAIYRIY
jgi:hypothetical protein